MRRDPGDHVLERALPEKPSVAHAVNVTWHRRSLNQPQFLDRFSVKEALCGKRVRVLLPLPFRPLPDDADQCARCRARLMAGETLPPLRRRWEDEAVDASEGTGVAPSSGHIWTGRTWTFGDVDGPKPDVADVEDEAG